MTTHEKEIYSQYQLNELKRFRAHLESNEALLVSRFKKIIERYKKSNQHKLPAKEQNTIEIEFFHGSGDLRFTFYSKTERTDSNVIFEDGSPLFEPYNENEPPHNDFIYPDSLDIYYEQYRDGRARTERWYLTFEWLVNHWMKCGGHHVGIVAGTWQNNAAQAFNFNLVNWADYVDVPEPAPGQTINYPLKRDLTPFEVKQRVWFDDFQPYTQKRRYFEKDNEYYEIVYYANLMGRRSGKIVDYTHAPFIQVESDYTHSGMRFQNLKTIAKDCDYLINVGFQEKPGPDNGSWLSSDLVEIPAAPRLKDFIPIKTQNLDPIQQWTNLPVMGQYKWFIARTNNLKLAYKHLAFRLVDRVYKDIETFFLFNDLENQYRNFHSNHTAAKELVPFANDTEGGFLLIDKTSGEIFHWRKEPVKTHDSFRSFMADCREVSENFHPKIFHLEKGNIGMLKKWLAEGLDVTDESLFGGQKPITLSKNREVLELLCQHGSDLNDIRSFYYMNAQTIAMLFENGLDPNKTLGDGDWLRKEIQKNEDFRELRHFIP